MSLAGKGDLNHLTRATMQSETVEEGFEAQRIYLGVGSKSKVSYPCWRAQQLTFCEGGESLTICFVLASSLYKTTPTSEELRARVTQHGVSEPPEMTASDKLVGRTFLSIQMIHDAF